jgi:hypothetical protein
MNLSGKQILDNTLTNNKFKINTDTIISNDNASNKDYLNQNLLNNSNFYFNKLNLNMPALSSTTNQLACNIPIIEFPLTTVLVKLNGALLNINLDYYFSPDGIIQRSPNNIQKGDYLYWNNSNFNLETTDELDFNFMTGYYYKNLGNSATTSLSVYNNIVIKILATSGNSIYLLLTNYIVDIHIDSNNNIIFDYNGLNQHTFSTNGKITISINSINYVVWCDDILQKIISIEKL